MATYPISPARTHGVPPWPGLAIACAALLAPVQIASAPVSAANAPKTAAVTLSWAAGSTADSLAATATTPKDGTTFVDAWSGDDGVTVTWVTAKDGSGSYVSSAVVTFPGAGTYQVTYAISMRAPGGTTWLGSHTVSVTVGPDGAVPPGGGGGSGI